MNKVFGRLALLLASCLALATPAAGPAPAIKAEFQYRQSLELSFPQPMQTWQNERRGDVVTLQPALPTLCAWSSDTQLSCAFSGDAVPAAATRYRIHVVAGLKTQSGDTLPALALSAETRRPALSASISDWAAGVPRIVVGSDANSTAQAMAAVLRLRVDGKPVALPLLQKLEPQGNWDRGRYVLALPALPGKDQRVVLAVVPGLKSSEGPLPGTQDGVLLDARINEPFRLRGVACAGRNASVSAVPVGDAVAIDCTPGETLQLVFSQRPDMTSRKALEDALPQAVKLRDWSSSDDWRWRQRRSGESARAPAFTAQLQVAAADTSTALPLPASMRAESGDALEPMRVDIRTGDYRPVLRARHPSVLVADGARPPLLVEALNAGATTLAVQAVGPQAAAETLALPAQTRRNQPEPVPSALTARTLAQDGWVRWTPQREGSKASTRYSPQPAPVQFAAPGFDLFAVAGRRQVLAWANAWDADRSVAGAGVELLWLDPATAAPRVIARARTGADGVALLQLPEAFEAQGRDGNADDPMWLVRATHGHGKRAARAVLPLGTPQRYGLTLGRVADTKLWGVADRPLYRAGDTVKYRLWQRAESGGRLLHIQRPQPLALKLYNVDEDKALRQWQATPDADGGIVGTLALPIHLDDATYCIGAGEEYSVEGACFFVGTYRAQDLWVEASTEDRVLRDGDSFAVDVAAGYYSGGPAAGVAVSRVTTMLTGLPLQQAYPQYADYQFIDVMSEDARNGIALAGERDLHPLADGEGKARIALPLRIDSPDPEHKLQPPAFGRVQLVAEVKLADRESTASNAASARYARFDRYVGLRLEPRWLDATTPVKVEGMVIDAEGKPVADAPIVVEVQFLPGFDDGDKAPSAQTLTRCDLVAGAQTACDFPRKRSGRYRLAARSGDAAPATLTQYVWAGDDDASADTRRTELELLDAPQRPGADARVLLKQPLPGARVLFVFGSGDAILGHRVETIAGNARGYALPTSSDWRGTVALSAYVRDSQPREQAKDGYRIPVPVLMASTQVSLPRPADHQTPLALAFDAKSAKPGDKVRITLRNNSAAPRAVVLAVVDDALRALADDFLPYFDPHGEHWLGARNRYGYSRYQSIGFFNWNSGDWRWLLPWPQPGHSAAATNALHPCAQGDAAAQAACAAARAASAAADAAAIAGTGDGVAVEFDPVADDEADAAADAVSGISSRSRYAVANAPPAPRVVFDEPSPMDTPRPMEIKQLAPPPPPQSPPLPSSVPMLPVTFEDAAASTSLDRIMVTGSRIDRVDVFTAGATPSHGLRPREEARTLDQRRSLRALVRVRTQFADTALWQPEIRLAPGESRSIELTLPDNLTRWRAIAWSSDADDDFDMAEATVETGLPVEVRLQAPVRIYPGDRSRLAANARQINDASVQAQTEMHVEGIGEPQESTQPLTLAARGQGSFALEIAPQVTGKLLATASAQTPAGRDAVAATVEVATPLIDARKVQAGWLGDAPLTLDLPTLPAGASDPRLQVSLLRGGAGLVERWTQDLRDYPHRCWEQILSRGVAAALALERGDPTWPDAQSVVDEALDNAAVFQGQEGDFRYFAEEPEYREFGPEPQPQIALTAYTLRAFALLRSLGHPVAARVDEHAREFLENGSDLDVDEPDGIDLAAFAASALAIDADSAGELWQAWDKLSLPARIAATRAMAASGHPSSSAAMQRLLDAAPARGARRVLQATSGGERWMRSDLGDQCALIKLLRDYPKLADADARRGLIAGLTDLYAGGIDAVDTQTGALCLVALRESSDVQSQSPSATVHIGDATSELRVPDGQSRADLQLTPANVARLRIEPHLARDAPASFVVELSYREDARQARASAVGFSIERRYEVLRAGGWMAVAGQGVREGDWLRVTLTVQTAAPRHFVAVTDAVAGGLRPTDLALSSIAGLDLAKVSDEGSFWFGTRRLDPRSSRFYAEFLPAGRHEIHYFARAGNAGDYLAAPAFAELMYGNASNARTAAQRLRIEVAEGTK